MAKENSFFERDRVGVQDMVLLQNYTSEAEFIDNLRKRFHENIIYTYIGPVLLSVNPYKLLPIYNEQYISKYNKRHFFENPPHIYAVTDNAYYSLLENRVDQCILISGESGAGKTEASKKVLQYIAAASGHKTKVEGVKDKLLQSNPVLEAFGNAKTNRNDNSSRFGKYMDIIFDVEGEPIGGNITNYLLEKSRVVRQSHGERNFHIFYQLVYGADDSLIKLLYLNRNPANYFYLAQHGKMIEKPINDETQYRDTKTAMQVMGLDYSEQLEIFCIVAAILHLGNITFTEKDDNSVIKDKNILEHLALLLKCNAAALGDALTQRSIIANTDVVISSLNKDLAEYVRDALAKAVYDRLFTWLVQRINKSLQPAGTVSDTSVIGILDIYGFEVFRKNSFEQFCINYCNEKLQQLFVELTLKSEQEEYLREGIEWENIHYFDNKIICNLVEEKHKGIISLLDEECLRPGDRSDNSFLEKMCYHLSHHEHFISFETADKEKKKKMSREEFQLVHYAGTVTYDVSGFIEKNNDLLFRDLTTVLSSSKNVLLQEMFPKNCNGSKKRPQTAITQFRISVNQLMDILKTKEPSYIRCIKPNDFKLPCVFNDEILKHQVTYLGLMENVRLRRAGFAYRDPMSRFLQRYKCLCPATWPNYHGHPKQGITELMTYLGYDENHYRLGNTKVFIRHSKTLFEIDDQFQIKKQQLVAKIQSVWRGFVQRRKYALLRSSAIIMQTWIRRYLAQKTAERRRKAVLVVRNFIKGFITRDDEPNDLNRRFVVTARASYLRRLSQALPRSVLNHSWPAAPNVCREASQQLRKLHRAWLARKYRMSLSNERRKQFKLKVLAESLFKGKKKSYQSSVGPKFINDRLNAHQKVCRSAFQSINCLNEKLMYSSPVVKFDRHGYKRRDRILLVTKKAIYVLVEEGKSFKLKHRLPFSTVLSLDVTSEYDNLLLLKIPADLKDDKGDLILEIPNLIECITYVIKATKDPDMLHINNVENGTITHNLVGSKPRVIDFVRGQNGSGIEKGKNGNLIIVG